MLIPPNAASRWALAAVFLLTFSLLTGRGVNIAAAQQVVSTPAYYDPAGADGTRGTADDDYRPNKNAGSDLIDAGRAGVGLADNLDIDGDGNTSEPIPGPFTTAARNNGSAPDLGMAESSGNALPVEMAGVEARYRSASGGAVVLSWQTASETGNAGFAVERRVAKSGPDSTAGGMANWTQVGRVEGAGTTAEPQSYRFVDEGLPFEAGRFAYRLRQIDTDGTETVSGPVMVERPSSERLLLRPPAPNPAATRATVKLAVPDAGQASLRLFDVMGREVRTVAVQGGREALTLDLSGLASGTYVLRLRAEGASRTRRLTVVR